MKQTMLVPTTRAETVSSSQASCFCTPQLDPFRPLSSSPTVSLASSNKRLFTKSAAAWDVSSDLLLPILALRLLMVALISFRSLQDIFPLFINKPQRTLGLLRPERRLKRRFSLAAGKLFEKSQSPTFPFSYTSETCHSTYVAFFCTLLRDFKILIRINCQKSR